MTAEVLEVMADLAATGQTMIVVTHAMNFARRAAKTVHVFHEGNIAESGPPEQIFEAPQTPVTRRFLARMRSVDRRIKARRTNVITAATGLVFREFETGAN